jgi:hypothetical protein
MPNSVLYIALLLSLAATCPLDALAKGQEPGSATQKKSIPHTVCPEVLTLELSATYPKDTGNAEVDQFFLKNAIDYMADVEASSLEEDEVLTNGNKCSLAWELTTDMTFEATKPNDKVLGVLLDHNFFLGGAHPSHWYRSVNFDLGTGKEITIQDLFSDPQKGITGIYALAYGELCSEDNPQGPAKEVLGGVCGEAQKPPAELLAVTGSLDGLGHMTLTPEGARLSFQAYEIWTYSKGDYELEIPASALLALGSHDYWGGKATPSPEAK